MNLQRSLARFIWLLASLPALAGPPPDSRVIILLGAPGSGKTTQAAFISRRYHIPAISASELLKKSHGRKSKLSKPLEIGTASGDLVNDDALNELFRARVEKPDALHGFILDGYPASTKQADYLAGLLSERQLPEPTVIVLDAPDAVVKQRMERRHRVDDQPAIIERRLADYRREEQFIVGHYGPGRSAAQARLFRVDATKTEAEVSQQITALLERPAPAQR